MEKLETSEVAVAPTSQLALTAPTSEYPGASWLRVMTNDVLKQNFFMIEEHGDLDILIGLAEDFPGQDFLKLCVFWAAFSDLGCFGVMKLAAKVLCPLPS